MHALRTVLVALWALSPAVAAGGPAKVLCLCDSVHRNTAREIPKLLGGEVSVVVPKLAPGDSGTVLGRLPEILGDEKWDLIYFNFGFADLRYKDPKTKSIRLMSKHAGGVRVSTPEQYEKNLRKVVEVLKASGASLLWLATTPIEGDKHDSILDPGSEVVYNAIAARVMSDNNVPTLDMHAWTLANAGERGDPLSFKGISIHEPVAEAVGAALGLR